ncbi:hypothetical protein Bca4012_094719 [Brassica carinata]
MPPPPRDTSIQSSQKENLKDYRLDISVLPPSSNQQSFRERFDRHGKSFGDRVSTKQTRNPPPERLPTLSERPKLSWRESPVQDRPSSYASPPYSKSRNHSGAPTHRSRDIFPQRSQGQWRPKQTLEPQQTSEAVENFDQRAPEKTFAIEPLHTRANGNQVLTREAIMEDLHKVTKKYLSCPDPVEAAVRRQRVLYSDDEGLMEATSTTISASTTTQLPLAAETTASDSNPVTPPPEQVNPLQALIFPPNLVIHSPHSRAEEDEILDPYYSDVSPHHALQEQTNEADKYAKLKSIIVSPQPTQVDRPIEPQNHLKSPEENETLREFQSKLRKSMCIR